MSYEQPATLVSSPPEPEKVKKILLLDADPTSRDNRAKAIRDRGAQVDCAGGGDEARALWKPGCYELVLIEFRSAGVEADDFYHYARLTSRKQRFGFYLEGPPYLTLSHQQYESSRVPADCEPAGRLSALAEGADGKHQTGLPEAAKRIATVRRLTRPGTTEGGAPLRGTSVSAAMKIASRVLGGGA
jgi:CheY-like chemotaxis protein